MAFILHSQLLSMAAFVHTVKQAVSPLPQLRRAYQNRLPVNMSPALGNGSALNC